MIFFLLLYFNFTNILHCIATYSFTKDVQSNLLPLQFNLYWLLLLLSWKRSMEWNIA